MNTHSMSRTTGEAIHVRSYVPVVVFADIDEAWLPTDTSVRPAVINMDEMLADENVMVVMCSSMTRAELEICQQALGNRQPFVCESAAAVLVPHGYFSFDVPCDRNLCGYHVIEFGRPYDEVVEVLHRTSRRIGLPVIGFSDLSVEEVASDCGLSLSQARLAKLREYDEPFRLVDGRADAHDRLWRALHANRLSCTHTGTFEHVGAPVDYRTSIEALGTLYRCAFGTVMTVRLGHRATGDVNPSEWVDMIRERARRARRQRDTSIARKE